MRVCTLSACTYKSLQIAEHSAAGLTIAKQAAGEIISTVTSSTEAAWEAASVLCKPSAVASNESVLVSGAHDESLDELQEKEDVQSAQSARHEPHTHSEETTK